MVVEHPVGPNSYYKWGVLLCLDPVWNKTGATFFTFKAASVIVRSSHARKERTPPDPPLRASRWRPLREEGGARRRRRVRQGPMGLAEVTTILVQGLRARDSEGCHRLRASSFLARGRVGQGQVYEDNDGSYRTEGRGGGGGGGARAVQDGDRFGGGYGQN
ncbi:hypothetical protein B296_00047439 [Ensete ventricosum]|uniref:Uncharacterized protein n=1 Tax=Ensete ventricosum TaxID=4639 RepID=A0A426XR50_ENSVE|nr:hypothetical protein B296_00047439 [Ensete ventricosum]